MPPAFGNDIHTTELSFAMRQRLLAANGTAANQGHHREQPTVAIQNAVNVYELDAMNPLRCKNKTTRVHRSTAFATSRISKRGNY